MNTLASALLFAALLGAVAGLRAMTPLAVLAWGAHLGWINLDGSWAQWLGSIVAVVILSLLAVGELITDQLPSTPSRKVPVQFGARVAIGAFAGAVIGTALGHLPGAIVAGVVGAVLGTLGGAQARGALATRFGNDRHAALLEDAVAIVGGLLIVCLAGMA